MDFSRDRFVLDGGLATEIENRGYQIHGDPLWSARLLYTHPEVIADIHKSYLRQGADVITTASYQCSVEGFCKHLSVSREEALGLIDRSVTLAADARDWFLQSSVGRNPPLIAGSVGPYGACLHDGSEYHGNYVDHVSKDKLMDWHKLRFVRLLNAGVDVLACETIPAQAEAEALVALLQDFPNAKAWISFSCKDGTHTCHGDLFSEAVKAVSSSPQILAVGINCTSSRFVEPLLQSAQGVSMGKPFVVYPNSGEDWSREENWSGSFEDFVSLIPRWMELGARVIGGCCRVGPEEIARIRDCVMAQA